MEVNEVEVLRKIVGKTTIEANKSENPALSKQLMSEWKEKEENLG